MKIPKSAHLSTECGSWAVGTSSVVIVIGHFTQIVRIARPDERLKLAAGVKQQSITKKPESNPSHAPSG